MDSFIENALKEAKLSLQENGIPIGAVLVQNEKIIGRGHNRYMQTNDPFAHAIIECIRSSGIKDSYSDTILYCTHMPCYMCAGAIIQFGIEHVIIGETTNYKGDVDFLKDHWISFEDLNLSECKSLMAEFMEKHPNLKKDNYGFF